MKARNLGHAARPQAAAPAMVSIMARNPTVLHSNLPTSTDQCASAYASLLCSQECSDGKSIASLAVSAWTVEEDREFPDFDVLQQTLGGVSNQASSDRLFSRQYVR